MPYKSDGIGVIYKLTSPNGKCYVGQSWNYRHRWNCYRNNFTKGQPKLTNAFKKHGSKNFKYEIIDKSTNQKELNAKEYTYISFYNSVKNGYNCDLSCNGHKHSEESKRKISIGRKKWLKNHVHNWLGKHHSKKAKKKMSLSQTGIKRPHTKEWKENMSKLMKKSGRKPPSWKGKKHSKKTINKMINVKSQLWLLTSPAGKCFSIHNLKAFCMSNSIHYSNLCRVAKGYRKSCHGWKAVKIPI